ncbi:aminotransferase class I/II-fold pyridoxal phosphate-dependent enzyme [Lentzea sp. PSKA42]|uniref:Aminotransferase class I/II-fold pyridoxal phosphate-dependent enzyme n=1 Tax=Lentzea indica TaxID=2604800 RepID=A0ABX1FTL8_9PSEU|nr:aminotransferase class I/II-fold pyridoxal phosphate-dependent enzyme [Lentzea indica]NKE62393.1 aminotransferase class I/II-fold pyridoxal phosphate-dependent enzyme [Lentzea indica]
MSALAVLGGAPAVPHGVDESRWPIVEDRDVQAVTDTLLSGKLSWLNDTRVPELERKWAAYVGAEHCIAVNSGTAALHAAVAAAGVGPGDEVLVPALSFLASATCVLHHQGVPAFVDIDPDTFTIDPARLEEKLTDRTKAIIAVHLHGLPADMDPITEFARKHDLVVIETPRRRTPPPTAAAAPGRWATWPRSASWRARTSPRQEKAACSPRRRRTCATARTP